MPIKAIAKKIIQKLGYNVTKHKQIQVLRGLDLPIKVMPNCKLLPNRDAALALLPKGGIVAEVGVAYGDFSRKIIDTIHPEKFYAVDSYGLGPGDDLWGTQILTSSKMRHEEFIKNKFKNEIEQKIFIIKKGFSWDVLETFEDNYFDYVYLDAGHDYDSVKKDVTVLYKKLKNNGIIQFNDYCLFDWIENVPLGIIRAVDELLVNSNHEILYYCLQKEGFHDIVVKLNK